MSRGAPLTREVEDKHTQPTRTLLALRARVFSHRSAELVQCPGHPLVKSVGFHVAGLRKTYRKDTTPGEP